MIKKYRSCEEDRRINILRYGKPLVEAIELDMAMIRVYDTGYITSEQESEHEDISHGTRVL